MFSHPYEKESLDLHREMTDAARPARRAVQSKNMWKESDIKPKLRIKPTQKGKCWIIKKPEKYILPHIEVRVTLCRAFC